MNFTVYEPNSQPCLVFLESLRGNTIVFITTGLTISPDFQLFRMNDYPNTRLGQVLSPLFPASQLRTLRPSKSSQLLHLMKNMLQSLLHKWRPPKLNVEPSCEIFSFSNFGLPSRSTFTKTQQSLNGRHQLLANCTKTVAKIVNAMVKSRLEHFVVHSARRFLCKNTNSSQPFLFTYIAHTLINFGLRNVLILSFSIFLLHRTVILKDASATVENDLPYVRMD